MGNIFGAVLGAGGAIGGAIIQKNAAQEASKKQVSAARNQLELERDIFNLTREDLAPFVEGGQVANQALLFELGLGDAPTIGAVERYRVGDREFETRDEAEARLAELQRPTRRATTYTVVPNEREGGFRVLPQVRKEVPSEFADLQIEDISTPGRTFGGFQETQDYTFGFDQGRRAVDASAAAGGTLNSGATLQALNEFGQNFASLRRAEYLNRLGGLSGVGLNATNALASANQSYAAGAGQAFADIGNARSAASIAKGNAYTSALNSLANLGGQFAGGLGGGGVGSLTF